MNKNKSYIEVQSWQRHTSAERGCLKLITRTFTGDNYSRNWKIEKFPKYISTNKQIAF